MARIVNSPLSASTVNFQYLSGGSVQTLTLDATSFMGGGGATYNAGSGLTLNGTTFSVESTIYGKMTSMPAFGSNSSYFLANNGTWQSIQASPAVVFTASATSFLSGGANVLSIYNAASTGQPVYIYCNVYDSIGGNAMWHIDRCFSFSGIDALMLYGAAVIYGLSTQLKMRTVYGTYTATTTTLTTADFTITNS